MGQKVSPVLLRVGRFIPSKSMWYAQGRRFAETVYQDFMAREFLKKELAAAGVSSILIDRPAKNAHIRVAVGRPGQAIGKKGEDADRLRDKLSKIMGVPVHLTIEEVRQPDTDAMLVAESIAQQLSRRVMFRRAMKRAVSSALRAGAKGVKVMVSGRLGGAEIARTEWYREGRVPLHTFRADIDYALAEAKTAYGIIGVKVWIFKGEILDRDALRRRGATEGSSAAA